MGDASPSYRELSETLGMPIGSIGPTRQRYLKQLRNLINANAEEFRLRRRLTGYDPGVARPVS